MSNPAQGGDGMTSDYDHMRVLRFPIRFISTYPFTRFGQRRLRWVGHAAIEGPQFATGFFHRQDSC